MDKVERLEKENKVLRFRNDQLLWNLKRKQWNHGFHCLVFLHTHLVENTVTPIDGAITVESNSIRTEVSIAL